MLVPLAIVSKGNGGTTNYTVVNSINLFIGDFTNGKQTIDCTLGVQRAFSEPDFQTAYTANTGTVGTKALMENQPLTISCEFPNPTLGDVPITFTVIYQIV